MSCQVTKKQSIEATEDRGDEEQANKKVKLDTILKENVDQPCNVHDKILKQIEYYFSDVNIVRDKFMLNEIEKDSGWIPISTLLKFSKLRELTKIENDIVEAIKANKSDIIEIDDKSSKIRRLHPIPDIITFTKSLDERTIHLRCFPTDYTYENLRTFCEQFGQVESIMMRRHFKTKAFKGNINVVYKEREPVTKILAMEEFKCKDREIVRESMADYNKRKNEFKMNREAKRKNK